MRTAKRGVLAIDKGIVLLAILVGMGEGNLDILALQVNNIIKGLVIHTVSQQIAQTIT